MQTATTCSSCGGSGQTLDKRPPEADAQGLMVNEETVSIKIPAGVEDGMQLKVPGKGNEAPANGIPGDLLVAIETEEHATLKREGDNLHYDLYISISDAVLGTSKEIDTVNQTGFGNTIRQDTSAKGQGHSQYQRLWRRRPAGTRQCLDSQGIEQRAEGVF